MNSQLITHDARATALRVEARLDRAQRNVKDKLEQLKRALSPRF